MEKDEARKINRCAIYTRKSTSDGLEQDFTSLDAQRESAESYIQSQKQLGWTILPFRYDDGGFTGATTDRPALQRLLQDINDKKLDCIVVYKVDRLSRSLRDFVKLLQYFEEHQVTFVSVTQHFNTNTSMGRLTLNILLSFAQFEREMISERTKDKMGAARKKGRWVGGRAPLGYSLDKNLRKLVINHEEAARVRLIFELYFEKKSFFKVAEALTERGFRTKLRENEKQVGGVLFKPANVQAILKNHTYLGKVFYDGKIYPGDQEAIISQETFDRAQAIMKENQHERNISKTSRYKGMLSSILRCACCEASMCHAFHPKNGSKYRYYICLNALKRGRRNCPTKSLNAPRIEAKCLELLKRLIKDDRLSTESWESRTAEEQGEIMRSLVKSINYDGHNGKIVIELHSPPGRHEFDLPIHTLKSQLPNLAEQNFNREPPLRRQLLFAHQLQQKLDRQEIKDLKQVSEWTGINWQRLYQIMNLLYLAPQIQEDIIFRDYPKLLKTTERNIRHITDEPDWTKQKALWRLFLPKDPSK